MAGGGERAIALKAEPSVGVRQPPHLGGGAAVRDNCFNTFVFPRFDIWPFPCRQGKTQGISPIQPFFNSAFWTGAGNWHQLIRSPRSTYSALSPRVGYPLSTCSGQ
jgi:hypothetical protein